MAKRRKVGNLLALALLAGLREKPMHPYEMATLLRERGKEFSIKIQWGSLYTVVQNLEKHGFVEAVDTTRQGKRPERTVYAITAAGRAELDDWMCELLAEPRQEFTAYEAALSNAGVLAPDTVIDLLRRRIAALDAVVRDGREELTKAMETVPRLFLVEGEYKLAMAEAEANWTRSLLTELVDGTMPSMDVWRRYHQETEED
ncbi:PadR family transcriptional regulator [Virgisporangium aurantiacum]|uniref:PadR family transcriptional regulator n=1 Tax=Virgisporangium aurantiacum TaxID=175570 RepID=A0A8J3ZI50_9ACTN|nr:PadR family transcriptional regulator [Virgisporangium aurantiacum]GIJ61956.1 PadR family transcriptional regulator [Virgisporangium aurantiacum]